MMKVIGIMRFHSNAGMCSHSDHVIVILHNDQDSQELKTMSKTPLENDIFCSKNNTFHNQMMTNPIFEHLELYFDVIFLYEGNTFILLCIFFELYADKYLYSSITAGTYLAVY